VSPVEGLQQVQLGPVGRVDEFTLNRKEAAVLSALRRRRRARGVEQTPGPHLTAARTCRSEVNAQLVGQTQLMWREPPARLLQRRWLPFFVLPPN